MVIVSNFKLTEMKSINIFFAALILISAAVGCVKQENPTFESNGYKVEFNVADKAGFGAPTKAVKTSWEAGDQIAISFQPGATGDYIIDNSIIYLNYDGTSWSSSTVSSDLAAKLGASGDYTAVHYRTAGDNISFKSDGTFATYVGGIVLYSKGTYEILSDVLYLGEINMAFGNTAYGVGQQFQVSVKGLNEDGEWQMIIGDNTYTPSANRPTSLAVDCCQEDLYRLNTTSGYIGTWGGNDKYSPGVKYNGDMSFVFIGYPSNTESDANDKYHFYLTNGTDVYTYTVDRGEHDGSKYAKSLNIHCAYLLPAITEEGKWVKKQ